MIGANYPGYLLDAELSVRLMKCYAYKFVKNRIARKSKYDKVLGRMTEKKYFHFNLSKPMFAPYHSVENLVRLDELLGSGFLSGKSHVFFVPHYRPIFHEKGRKAFVYCCAGLDLEEYFRTLDEDCMQNVTIFDSSYSWAIDIFDDTVPDFRNYKDVVVYFRRPGGVNKGCI